MLAASIALKAVIILMLVRIGWGDLTEQRIANRDVLVLLALGILSLTLRWLDVRLLSDIVIAVAAGLMIFCLLIPFWLLRKVGAGDVKLLSVAPIVSGASGLLLFSLCLLVTAALTAFVVRNPLVLPEGMFRGYVLLMDRKGVVPFGVPIAVALIGVLLSQMISGA
jgi:prepilin peptidase CpaA